MECFVFIMVLWIFSVCLHEFGHAWVAEKGGDYTVREKGYLSMNPIHYAHPLLSFVLPMVFMMAGGIGLPGGAVYLQKNLLRSRSWETAVSLAGPAMNLLLTIILTLLLRLVLIPHFPEKVATYAAAFALQLQISAILFNLIPMPPLDGYQALEPWLPMDFKQTIRPLWEYGLFILFILFWNVPFLNQVFWSVVYFISDALGVPAFLGYEGFKEFQFWRH